MNLVSEGENSENRDTGTLTDSISVRVGTVHIVESADDYSVRVSDE